MERGQECTDRLWGCADATGGSPQATQGPAPPSSTHPPTPASHQSRRVSAIAAWLLETVLLGCWEEVREARGRGGTGGRTTSVSFLAPVDFPLFATTRQSERLVSSQSQPDRRSLVPFLLPPPVGQSWEGEHRGLRGALRETPLKSSSPPLAFDQSMTVTPMCLT